MDSGLGQRLSEIDTSIERVREMVRLGLLSEGEVRGTITIKEKIDQVDLSIKSLHDQLGLIYKAILVGTMAAVAHVIHHW